MRMRRTAMAMATLLLATAAARADLEVKSTVGFDNTCVAGSVTAVTVTLKNTGKDPLDVQLDVTGSGMLGVGGGRRTVSSQVMVAAGGARRVVLPLVPPIDYGQSLINLNVTTDRSTVIRQGETFVKGNVLKVLAGATGAAEPNIVRCGAFRPVLGVFGSTADAARFLGEPGGESMAWQFRPQGNRAGFPSAELVFINPGNAPDNWLAYEGVDGILWVDPDPATLADPAQLGALLDWTARGGRLTVALTPSARLPAGSMLSDLLPALPRGHTSRKGSEILAALGSGESTGDIDPKVPVADVDPGTARVVLRLTDGTPLLVARDFGMGTLNLCTFDPRPLSGYMDGAEVETFNDSRSALLGHLLGSRARVPEDNYQDPGLQGDTITEHLRRRFLRSPPLGFLVLGLILYVLAIGPVDYFVLKRRNALRKTVYTFPAIVVGFTLLAYGASFLLFGATSGRSRVAWLDFATAPAGDADVVRGLDFAGLYSPIGTRWRVQSTAATSFSGAPWIAEGNAWRGSSDDASEVNAVVGDGGRMALSVPVPLRAHRTIQSRIGDEVPTSLDAVVETRDGKRVLRVTNRFALPVHDALLVTKDGIVLLGEIPPGGTVEAPLSPITFQSDAAGFLRTPFSDGGLFAGNLGWRYGNYMNAELVPEGADPEAWERARILMARAATGAGIGELAESVWGSAEERAGGYRMMARYGLDLSEAVRAGRPLVTGWCDGDPLGLFPADDGFDAQVVVVRRLLPTEETR